MEKKIFDEIKSIENIVGKLSSAEKILLSTDGSVTTILDVLKGHVSINTLVQEFIPADKKTAEKLNINPGETVNYRVVIIGTEKPLIHAVSYIPVKRLDNEFKEDLIRANMPIGRILKKHHIESRREIKSLKATDTNPELSEIFKNDSIMLSRVYNIIHREEILIRIKETFPHNLFKE